MIVKKGGGRIQKGGENLFSLLPSTFSLLILFIHLSLAFCQAQEWTIQTVAFRDYRDAQAAVQQLQALGFEAYVEFSNGSDGLQYARVRVGCFDSQETADLTVQHLIGVYTKEAVSVPLSAGAPVPYCIRREVGFIMPTRWYTYFTTATEATFMVDLQGKQAFLKHDGATWQMGQNLSELGITAVPPSVGTSGYFSEVAASPFPQILYRSDISLLISQGKLLWQQANVVLVQENDMIVAYYLDRR
jgi:SPOR domain